MENNFPNNNLDMYVDTYITIVHIYVLRVHKKLFMRHLEVLTTQPRLIP